MHLNVVYCIIGNVYPNASVSINILITLQVIKKAVGTEKYTFSNLLIPSIRYLFRSKIYLFIRLSDVSMTELMMNFKFGYSALNRLN